MAAKEWVSITARVEKTLRDDFYKLCESEKISANVRLTSLIKEEVEHLQDPAVLPKHRGVPQTGENVLAYVPEKDSFVWQLNLGVHGIAPLSEDVSPYYLENLQKAIQKAIEERRAFQSSKKGVVVPTQLLRYGVKNNARG